MTALDVLPWWVRWVSPGVTLCLGLAMLVFGSELWWRGAVRSLARLGAQHWSERARIWFAWRGVISGWHVSIVVGICLVESVLAAHNTIRSTLCLAVVASMLSVLLLAPRTSHWVARVTGTKCRVKSFKAKFGPWSTSWPGTFSKTTTIYLAVKFDLELEEGCDESQCCIRQDKRGRLETNHYVAPEHENFGWTADGQIGHLDWWDGQDWYGGDGSWDWNWGGPSIASFRDQPGFHSETDPYPLYYGGAGRRGHFEFRTYVYDAASGYTLRTINWGLLIDLSAPKSGRYYIYK